MGIKGARAIKIETASGYGSAHIVWIQMIHCLRINEMTGSDRKEKKDLELEPGTIEPIPAAEKICATCLFGGVIPEDLGRRQCKRHAPKTVLATMKGRQTAVPLTVFPAMDANDFCGDHTVDWKDNK